MCQATNGSGRTFLSTTMTIKENVSFQLIHVRISVFSVSTFKPSRSPNMLLLKYTWKLQQGSEEVAA